MTNLYEILVPTKYGDNIRPISTRHHKNWDTYVRKLSGGLTILTPVKGQYLYNHQLFEERIIPVRIMCSEAVMAKVVQFTLRHYRQKAVMFFLLSDQCFLVTR